MLACADGPELLIQVEPGELDVHIAAKLDLDERAAGTARRLHGFHAVDVADGLLDGQGDRALDGQAGP